MSPAGLADRALRRRFVLLTALRWLPVGLFAPVLVLLATSRGLTPVQIATAFAAHAVATLVLELPTGGLADALGRRPVLLLSGLLNLAAVLLLAVAQDVPGFALAMGVLGAGRALDSGPLEAWFVDALHEVAPGEDATPGLSRAGSAEAGGLAVGVLVGGALPLLGGGIVLPCLVAAGLTAVQLVAVALLVRETPRLGSARAALVRGAGQVPSTVRGAVALAVRDGALRRLLVVAAAVGWVLVTIEKVVPLRLVEVTGSERDAAAAFSLVLFAGWTASALAAPLAGPVRRLARGGGRAVAALSLLGAVALLGFALGAAVWLAVLAAVGFYAANSATWPLHKDLMHQRVDASQRATTLSAVSLSLQLGGLAGSFASTALLSSVGHEAAFGLAALVLLASGLVALRLPDAATARVPA